MHTTCECVGAADDTLCLDAERCSRCSAHVLRKALKTQFSAVGSPRETLHTRVCRWNAPATDYAAAVS